MLSLFLMSTDATTFSVRHLCTRGRSHPEQRSRSTVRNDHKRTGAMKHEGQMPISGEVVHVFAHRFVVRTDDGRAVLADLGPKGAEAVHLAEGLRVALEGEMKPSELKVKTIAIAGGKSVRIDHPKKHEKHPPHEHDVDPAAALKPRKRTVSASWASRAGNRSTSRFSAETPPAILSNCTSSSTDAFARRSRFRRTIRNGRETSGPPFDRRARCPGGRRIA
jgi:hypothetical protein